MTGTLHGYGPYQGHVNIRVRTGVTDPYNEQCIVRWQRNETGFFDNFWNETSDSSENESSLSEIEFDDLLANEALEELDDLCHLMASLSLIDGFS